MTLREPRPLPSPRFTLGLLTLALACGIALGLVARGPNVLAIDVDITAAIQRLEGSMFPALADMGNLLGSTTWAAGLIAVGLIGTALLGERAELVFLAVLLALRLAGTQLKPLFASPRPTDDLVTIVGDWHGTGYPSGHALTAATMALGLAVIAWRRIPSRGVAAGTIAMLGLLAVVVGWARVWSGAHWTTDVLGGYAFGMANTAAATLVLGWMTRREATDADAYVPTSV